MYNNDPIFEPLDHHLIAWVGTLTPDQLDAYLDEPGGAAYDEPFCDFMRDLGLWYDHDFTYAEASDHALDIRSLADQNCIDDDALLHELSNRVEPQSKWNCFIILWNARLIDQNARSRDLADGKLVCIGSWQHDSPLTD